jgi:hypothetical protein
MASFGPENATLTVHTKRAGAAAKAGHDLTILVERWSATLDDDELSFEADPRSLRVLEGHGGITTLGDEEKAAIKQTIDEDVLKGTPIRYRAGELTINGVTRAVPYRFSDGQGRAEIRQSDFGIKPYSALFGTLKVADVVEVTVRSNDG